ncbi:MAG: YiiX/YebB-like N1pC/P60 family cysteine hydrolase, partial [Ignavibacteriaceae bacterium]
MTNRILLSLILLVSIFSYSKDSTSFELREGDLLFQDIDCGPLCDAIEKVTKGINGANFSHIGITVKDSSNNIMILEAVGEGIKLTALNNFLGRSFDNNGNPKVVAGRLKPEYRHIIPGIINEAKSYIGKPYDTEYRLDNNSYYCSELIYLAAYKANNGEPLFELQPMTFKDPDTGEFYPASLRVEVHHGPQAVAARAGPLGIVKGKQLGGQFRVADAAVVAGKTLGKKHLPLALDVDHHLALGSAQGQFHGIGQAPGHSGLDHQAVHHHFQIVFLFFVQDDLVVQGFHLAVDPDPDKAVLAQLVQELAVLPFSPRHQRRHD